MPKQGADLTSRFVIVATWGGLGAAALPPLGILPVLAALAWLAV